MTTKFISDMGPKSALIAPRPFQSNFDIYLLEVKIGKQ